MIARRGARWAVAALALALAAAAATAASGCKRDRTIEALALVRAGDAALAGGKLDRAEASYRRAVELVDEVPGAWVGLGRVLNERSGDAAGSGDVEAALGAARESAAAFARATKVDPGDADAWVGLGWAWIWLDEPERAYAAFVRLLELRPDEPRAHGAMAVALTDLGRFAEALPHFDRALEAFGDSQPPLLFKAAKAFAGLDRPAQALELYLKYHELVPDDPRYLDGAGEAFLRAGMAAEALGAYERLADAGHGFLVDALLGQGAAHLLAGDAREAEARFEEGLALLERAGAVAPGGGGPPARKARARVAAFHVGLARVKLLDEKLDDALADLRAAVAADPGHHPAGILLGSVLMTLKRYDDAVAALETVVKRAEWMDVPAGMLADALAMAKKYERARAAYERALRLAPEEPTMLNNYAWMLVTAEDSKFVDCARGAALAERSVTLSASTSAASLDTLAEAYHCLGRFDDALRVVERALHVSPADPELFARRDKYEAARAAKSPPAK